MLRVLREAGELEVSALAEKLGVPAGKLKVALDALVAARTIVETKKRPRHLRISDK